MTTIILYDLLQNNSYSESGSCVFEMTKDVVLSGGKVVIDMTNVESVPTNFLNTSFGALMDVYGAEKVRKSFAFKNILKSQVKRISKYFNDYQSLLSPCC